MYLCTFGIYTTWFYPRIFLAFSYYTKVVLLHMIYLQFCLFFRILIQSQYWNIIPLFSLLAFFVKAHLLLPILKSVSFALYTLFLLSCFCFNSYQYNRFHYSIQNRQLLFSSLPKLIYWVPILAFSLFSALNIVKALMPIIWYQPLVKRQYIIQLLHRHWIHF